MGCGVGERVGEGSGRGVGDLAAGGQRRKIHGEEGVELKRTRSGDRGFPESRRFEEQTFEFVTGLAELGDLLGL